MRPELLIRRGTHGDASCLSALSTQVWLHTYATNGIRPVIAQYVQEHLSPNAFALHLEKSDLLFLVAEIDGNLVGYIGRELLSRFRAELARLVGADALWLTVNSQNRKARTFYERQGLKDVGTTYFDLYGEKHENRVLCTSDA